MPYDSRTEQLRIFSKVLQLKGFTQKLGQPNVSNWFAWNGMARTHIREFNAAKCIYASIDRILLLLWSLRFPFVDEEVIEGGAEVETEAFPRDKEILFYDLLAFLLDSLPLVFPLRLLFTIRGQDTIARLVVRVCFGESGRAAVVAIPILARGRQSEGA